MKQWNKYCPEKWFECKTKKQKIATFQKYGLCLDLNPWCTENVTWNTQYPGNVGKWVITHHLTKAFSAINAWTIKRLGGGDGRCSLEARADPRGESLVNSLEPGWKSKIKNLKWSCAPRPTPHKWWWNAFVNLSWCLHPELITLPTLNTWQFASNPIWNAYCTGFF